MIITKLGPTENFAAINPPLWLAGDLSRLANSVPHFRLLTLFTDDLPRFRDLDNAALLDDAKSERLMAIEALHDAHLSSAYHPLQLTLSMTGNILGQATHNARDLQVPKALPSHITGEPLTRYHFGTAATAGIIILPSRHITADQFAAATLGVPNCLCERFNDVTIARGILGHEYGHMLRYMQQPFTIRRRASEQEADKNIDTVCQAANDAPTADYFKKWRTVSNFLGPIRIRMVDEDDTRPSDYWHDLAAHNIKASTLDEYAAMGELKVRAMGLTIALPDRPQKFVRQLFSLPVAPRPRTEVFRLRQLLEHHDKPYKYAHSEALACKVLNAAHELVPGAFR